MYDNLLEQQVAQHAYPISTYAPVRTNSYSYGPAAPPPQPGYTRLYPPVGAAYAPPADAMGPPSPGVERHQPVYAHPAPSLGQPYPMSPPLQAPPQQHHSQPLHAGPSPNGPVYQPVYPTSPAVGSSPRSQTYALPSIAHALPEHHSPSRTSTYSAGVVSNGPSAPQWNVASFPNVPTTALPASNPWVEDTFNQERREAPAFDRVLKTIVWHVWVCIFTSRLYSNVRRECNVRWCYNHKIAVSSLCVIKSQPRSIL